MTVALLTFLAFSAADDPQLALGLKAQTQFERIQLVGAPQLKDVTACVQTQAALLPVAGRDELATIHYRKAYCTLLSATMTHSSGEFAEAAAEFDKAIQNWPARAPKGEEPPPVSPGLRVLAAVARLEAGTDESGTEKARGEIASAMQAGSCTPGVMSGWACRTAMELGRQWLGWIALRHGELEDAAHQFADSGASGWPLWVAGQQAFRQARYPEAAASYREAVAQWVIARKDDAPSFKSRLEPGPDLVSAYTDLGGAQLLAGDTASAIASLTEAVKLDPSDARALFLRGRAREVAGQHDAALADYNLASRTAFANARDLASGEAHLYRGIVMFRRKDYSHAEDEFASALNFEIPADLRADAIAWRHLAAVAGGSCDTSRRLLGESMGAVTPYFPKAEARNIMSGCGATQNGRTQAGGL